MWKIKENSEKEPGYLINTPKKELKVHKQLQGQYGDNN